MPQPLEAKGTVEERVASAESDVALLRWQIDAVTGAAARLEERADRLADENRQLRETVERVRGSQETHAGGAGWVADKRAEIARRRARRR